MWDFFKDLWGMFLSIALGFLWLGRLEMKVHKLDTAKLVTREYSDLQHGLEAQLAATEALIVKAEIVNLKEMIAKNDERSEQRHNDLILILQSIGLKK